MSRAEVLAAAALLHEFSAAQLAAWCEEDADAVAALLDEAGDVFVSQGSRWRVADPQQLHLLVMTESRTCEPRPDRPAARARGRSRGSQARLRMAEEILMDCAAEPTALGQRVMADSAMTYLRQFVADVLAGPVPWWEIEPAAADALPERVDTELGAVTRTRVRIDLALARLTTSVAAGVPVELDALLDIAAELAGPTVAPQADEAWLSRTCERFADLAVAALRPSVFDLERTAAPARLLSALTWRGALADSRGDPRRAVRRLERVLPAMAPTRTPATGGGRTCLFQVVDRLPRGRERINVYAALLEILPRQFRYQKKEDIVPGVLVTAVTDGRTSRHLRMYADTIEADLVRSDYLSSSALIGQTAHVVQDLAASGARMDDTVLERSDRARRGLLALAGVPV